MVRPNKKKAVLAAARKKGAAMARMHRQAQEARKTEQAIREEEILDEEMSVGSILTIVYYY